MTDRDIKDFTFIPVSAVKKISIRHANQLTESELVEENAYIKGWNDCVKRLLNKNKVMQVTINELMPIHCGDCEFWNKYNKTCTVSFDKDGEELEKDSNDFCSYGDYKDE